MTDLLDCVSTLIETRYRSPRAAAKSILKAVAVTLRVTPELAGDKSADWIESQLQKP